MAFDRPTRPLRIGDFIVDPGANELQRDGATQRLPSRIADLLLRLAREPGQLVRREQLIDEVWERRQVNDEVLSRAIADLRQFLGDDARAPRYVETLPKLGYRLVAVVAPADEAASAAATSPASEPAPTSPPPSAVAPPARSTTRVLRPIALLAVAALAALHLATRDATPPAAPRIDALDPARLLGARPFTAEPGRELFPRFTPDARWVVYTRAGDPGQAAELRLRAIDGTEDRALVRDGNDNFCGAVSPDGHALAWLRARPGVCELVHRAMLGGPARVLAGCELGALASCPDWSPDGARLVLGGDAQRPGLIEVDVDGGATRALSVPGGAARDLQPRYSPDGARIVFWRGDHEGRRLLSLQRDDGATTVLRDSMQLAFGHAFVDDGTLLLADDSQGQRSLVRFDPRSGASTLLGGADARHPDVARDGAIVYEVARYDANLWRVALDAVDGTPQRLTASARYDSQPSWSPDGVHLAFVSNRDGREGVYLMRADGGDERKLPLDPALRWTSPAWSPDAATLLVLRYDAHGARLCLHDLASARTECRDALGSGRHGGFFLDAATLAAIDAAGDAPTLWRIDLASGAAHDAGTGVVDRCAANARWLVCHRPTRRGLWLQDRRDAAVREIAADAIDGFGEWTLVGDAIYFAAHGDEPAGRAPGVHRLDLVDGRERRVSAQRPSTIGVSIAVSPDETQMVLARTDGLETDLMLVPPPAH